MRPVPQVMLFEAAASARPLDEQLSIRGFSPRRYDLAAAAPGAACDKLDIAVLLVGESADAGVLERTAELLGRLVAANVATVVWGATDNIRWASGPLVDWLGPDVSLAEVVGRLSTLGRYLPLMKGFERELTHLHRLGDQLNRYFGEIDQEMRLAGRLQRDFLPTRLPEVPGFEFSVLYRPASWVSGDLYDVFQIDEQHVGLFVADATGHGVAAGLLTMFLRQSLVPKPASQSVYGIVSPPAALAELHACLARQKLPNCQFVTAIYAILNTRTRELRLARGGHPYPFHIRAGGAVGQIKPSGGLLGLSDLAADFDEVRVRLAPGDKVVFFTDGLEDDFFAGGAAKARGGEISPAFREWAGLSATALTEAVRNHIDTKAGSLHPADDITLLTLEVDAADPQRRFRRTGFTPDAATGPTGLA